MAASDRYLKRRLVLSALTGFCLGWLVPYLGYGAGGFFVLSIITGTLWFLISSSLRKALRTFVFCSSVFVGLYDTQSVARYYMTITEVVFVVSGFIFLPTFIAAVADFLVARSRGKGGGGDG